MKLAPKARVVHPLIVNKLLICNVQLRHVERSVAQSKHPPEGYLVKRAPKCGGWCRWSCRGITLRANACSLASLRAIRFYGG